MNKKMIAFAVLVFAVVMTSFSVSGTYAKYTTTGSISDTARVAVWGIDLSKFNKESIDLFATAYSSNAIKSANAEKVVAPGAKGDYHFDLEITGTPEVAYTLTVNASVTDNTADTGRLKFALVTESATQGEAYAGPYDLNAAGLANKLKLLSGDASGSKEYAANEALFGGNKGYTIYWEWEFAESEKDSVDTASGNDAEKTGNGVAAAKVEVTITATQKNPTE